MNKLLIIDGHNYLYRAYYGLPKAIVFPNGKQGNAYYGFLSFLRKAIADIKPNHVIVTFDSETGTKSKLETNQEYKQNRNYTEETLWEQLPIIKKALEYIQIPYIEHPDYEADDIIGSIANQESLNRKVYISSGDKDFFQLINDNIHIVRNEKGENIIY